MNAPQTNRATCKQFLSWRYGDRPAQVVYGNSWRAAEATPEEYDALLDRVGDDRFYFAPCDLQPAWGSSTPQKEHVLSSQCIWFDYDAVKFGKEDDAYSDASGRHYANESVRVITAVQDGFERLGIKPSAQWHTGSGVQGVIRLAVAVSPEKAEALTAKLARFLGSDESVANRNRLLRVPGSVNPKSDYGRRPKETIFHYANDNVVTVDALEAALADVSVPAAPERLKKVKVKVDWDKAQQHMNPSFDDLDARGVSDKVLMLLRDGDVNNEYAKANGTTDHSRVFAAIARGLVDAGLSVEECAGALGSKSFLGNAHINKASTADRKRAIQNALGLAMTKTQVDKRRRATGEPEWRDYDSKTGVWPQPTLANAVIALKAMQVECRLDLFHDRVIISCGSGSSELSNLVGEFTDNAIRLIRSYVNNTWRLDLGEKNILDGVMELALANAADPVLDYLDECQAKWEEEHRLKGDEACRLGRAAVTHFNAEDTKLNCAIIETGLVASVRRARQAGCKFDNIIILESREGFNKSTAIRVTYGDENFSDQTVLGVSDQEVQEQLGGVWGHECADLSGMGKTEVERVKAFASRQWDRARPAFGRVLKRQPRRCVQWATTNDSEYLQSQNGNRRMWPLRVTSEIDVEKLKRDRDLLWGEAAHRESVLPQEALVNIERSLWPDATAEQEKRRVRDPWEDVLADIPKSISTSEFYDSTEKRTIIHETGAPEWQQRVRAQDLLVHLLHIPPIQQTTATMRRLGTVMRLLGWTKSAGALRFGDGEEARGFWRDDPAAPAQGALGLPPGAGSREAARVSESG